MLRFLTAAVLAAAIATTAQAQTWRGTWGASPALPMAARAGMPAAMTSPVIVNQTVVQEVRLSAGGERLRLRLSNEYGEKALQVGRVRVTVLDDKGAPARSQEVTFSGQAGATIPLKSPLVSDPVALPVPPLARLKIAVYFPGEAGPCTCHASGGQMAELSPPGDYTDRPFTPAGTTQARTFLSGVEVESRRGGPVIVAFGDSITDGYLSTVGANRRWPDRLAERLGGRAAVVNAGIGGNRVLSAGNIPIFGDPALARFDRDVLGVPGVSHLIVLEGVNDLGARPSPAPEALIAGYRQIIARAHAKGIKVILGTIVPYEGAAYFRAEGEATRLAVNRWIRTQKEADGFVDFDAATRDPARPARMRADYHAGDWLHPNDAGYRAMGEAVPLSLLR